MASTLLYIRAVKPTLSAPAICSFDCSLGQISLSPATYQASLALTSARPFFAAQRTQEQQQPLR